MRKLGLRMELRHCAGKLDRQCCVFPAGAAAPPAHPGLPPIHPSRPAAALRAALPGSASGSPTHASGMPAKGAAGSFGSMPAVRGPVLAALAGRNSCMGRSASCAAWQREQLAHTCLRHAGRKALLDGLAAGMRCETDIQIPGTACHSAVHRHHKQTSCCCCDGALTRTCGAWQCTRGPAPAGGCPDLLPLHAVLFGCLHTSWFAAARAGRGKNRVQVLGCFCLQVSSLCFEL